MSFTFVQSKTFQSKSTYKQILMTIKRDNKKTIITIKKHSFVV